jgi:hypothetical protein
MYYLTRLRVQGDFFFLVALVAFCGLPVAVAQEEEEAQSVSQEAIDQHEELQELAKDQRIDAAVQQDGTGTDPRAFNNKWMPFYRSQELENGLKQSDLTAFGTVGFSSRVGMFYEVPLAQRRDFSGISGFPSGMESTALGVGDTSLKFLINLEAMEFTFGEEGEKTGTVLLGTDIVLPTATEDALAGDALLFAPIVGVVIDMPFYGFFAALNLYYTDVYKKDSAPKTSRYVGRWFYMQPLTPPGPWWGGLYVMPEFQPVYDFETEDYSAWLGIEFGKMIAPGKIAYIKPGWGIDNSELVDRDVTFEAGFRWFF